MSYKRPAGLRWVMVPKSLKTQLILLQNQLKKTVLAMQWRNFVMSDFRIGQGFDIHKLVENRKLILGGIEIPFEKGLLGHSDADVLVHAVIDALLGAAALGDIGTHFPDTDDRYKGISSVKLLEYVATLVEEKGYRAVNIDATIIAQAPKMAPYIECMRNNIARALGIDVDCVNVKATTEEHLGFTGRKEGIAAHCVCLIDKK